MKDSTGQELAIGDWVKIDSSQSPRLGKILSLDESSTVCVIRLDEDIQWTCHWSALQKISEDEAIIFRLEM
jgi:hypothetical protein